jgi:hypothetical protein
MFDNIKSAVKPTDCFLEWSAYALDLPNIRNVFIQGGISPEEVAEVLPPNENCIPVMGPFRAIFQHIISPGSWKLETGFRVAIPTASTGRSPSSSLDRHSQAVSRVPGASPAVQGAPGPPVSTGFLNNLWKHLVSLGPRLEVKQRARNHRPLKMYIQQDSTAPEAASSISPFLPCTAPQPRGEGTLMTKQIRVPAATSTYCWVKPEISAKRSWVKPFSLRNFPKFRPTSLRISICASCVFTYYQVYLL